jgi:hypothetical protein
MFAVVVSTGLNPIGVSAQTRPDLSGRWSATGYTCFGQEPPTEEFVVVQTGTSIVVTKTIGDPCVPAGKTTFSGDLQTGAITYVVGTSAAPASGTTAGTIHVVDANHFTTTYSSYGASFTRLGPLVPTSTTVAAVAPPATSVSGIRQTRPIPGAPCRPNARPLKASVRVKRKLVSLVCIRRGDRNVWQPELAPLP